jgi:hypothetical protein
MFRHSHYPSSPWRAVFAAVVGAAVLPAHATTHVVDPITDLIREYSKEGRSAEYIESVSDQGYQRYVLSRLDFPYASEVVTPLADADAPTRRVLDSVSTAEHPINQRDLHKMKVWDLGFTKARMGYDIHWLPDGLDHPGGANAMKAGIEPDIYNRAFGLVGPGYPAIAGTYASAAQVLRAKLASTPRPRWKDLGLREDVIDHFVHAKDATTLSDFDLHYLIQFLDGEMATWDVGHRSAYGMRELPVVFRVGRAAAAYRERAGYSTNPCLDAYRYDPANAGMGGLDRRPLCFRDAIDRAVRTWYVRQLNDELTVARSLAQTGGDMVARMAVPLRSSRQGWIGITRPAAVEVAAHKEVIEAKVANTLLTAGDLSYRDASEATRRAMRLTCKDEL